MTASTTELLDLIARWVHVIAAIMWIGNSLLFNWLDRSLVPASGPGHTKKPTGTIWLLHSGGFYYVEKTRLDGEKLPMPLHWFKWQAFTTWISGALLLIIVYYAGGRAALEDPSVAKITHGWAVVIGISAIIGGRIIYDIMQHIAPRAPTLSAIIWIGALTAIAIELTQVLSGRAAFLHTGAMLGTIMAGNVATTIVSSQKELVSSVGEGRGADPVVAARAKRVSIHNNYFTFPVIALMVSSHFSGIYGHRLNWLLLLMVIAAGAAVRHVLNLRWTYAAWKPALAGTIAVSVIALWSVMNLGNSRKPVVTATASGPVSFEDARHVIDRRCAVCHSDRPTDLTFGPAPAGIKFDTPEEILSHAARIHERAYVSRTMPPGNKTGITDAEREILGRWSGLH